VRLQGVQAEKEGVMDGTSLKELRNDIRCMDMNELTVRSQAPRRIALFNREYDCHPWSCFSITKKGHFDVLKLPTHTSKSR
jgi:hypothetical protein